MAGVAADTAAAALVVAAVAGGAVIESQVRNGTVEALAVFVKPDLPGRVCHCCMAVVTTRRGVPIETVLSVAVITDSHIFSLNRVIRAAVGPVGTDRDLGARRTKMAGIATDACFTTFIICAMAGSALQNVFSCSNTVKSGACFVEPGLT